MAIVDWREVPTWTEFEILRDAFEAAGVPTIVCDPRDLAFDSGALRVEGRRIDLLYRRVLVNDIVARRDECRALVDAYAAGVVCMANTLRCKIPHKKAFFAILTDERFDPIVAFGENAAEPHHEPGHRMLEEGDVVTMDFGALSDGYHADMTRTVAFGEPAPELKKIHDVVRQAQQAGIDAVRQGVTGAEVDAAAREVIEGAGYGDAFTHGLGHGVGLEIHEGPRLSSSFADTLPSRSVVTVEPGIYVPGLGGVRIEDMVEVTDDGCRVIGSSTRELIEL